MALVAILSSPRAPLAASALDFQHDSPEEILLAQRSIVDSIVPQPAESGSAALPSAVTPEPIKHRSTGAAFLMNLAVPGVGHLYAGQKRGYINLGLEGVAWAAYLY